MQSSVRHFLSVNKLFSRVNRQESEKGVGGYWTINPSETASLGTKAPPSTPAETKKNFKKKTNPVLNNLYKLYMYSQSIKNQEKPRKVSIPARRDSIPRKLRRSIKPPIVRVQHPEIHRQPHHPPQNAHRPFRSLPRRPAVFAAGPKPDCGAWVVPGDGGAVYYTECERAAGSLECG
jgi:hypothetical protein